MHLRAAPLALFAFLAPLAQAMPIDAKALARFDNSYVFCETKFPEMKGHRDEAYLSIWRKKPDQKALQDLAATRQLAAYRAEQAIVQKAGARQASPPASSPLEHQCRVLWAEAQGKKKAKP